MRDVRVRFAPSPTGPLHIGGVRTALYNYLFAKHFKGVFVLRIEDTDQKRYVSGAEEYIHDALNWLGISPDESPFIGGEYGPYRQSERKDLYRKYAESLLSNDLAYYAFDTADEIEEMRQQQISAGSSNQQYNFETRSRMRNSLTLGEEATKQLLNSGEDYVIRIKMPEDEVVVIEDAVRGRVEINTSTLDDKVLMKSDGLPTYHLANVVDDHLMEISHVIRGEEWLPSAALHTILYQFLGWKDTMPTFAHLPLILKPAGKGKLSKRDADKGGFPIFPLTWTDPESGNISEGYRETGYLPDALANFLALLGWHPGTDEEILSLSQMSERFLLESVGKSGVRFDIDKAKWYNQEYIKARSNEDLVVLIEKDPHARELNLSKEQVLQVVQMMKERVTFPQQFFEDARFLFHAPDSYDEKIIRKRWNEDVVKVIQAYAANIEGLSSLSPEEAKSNLVDVTEQLGIGLGKIMQAFRVSLTGIGNGPDLMEIISYLGPKETASRIHKAVEELSGDL